MYVMYTKYILYLSLCFISTDSTAYKILIWGRRNFENINESIMC